MFDPGEVGHMDIVQLMIQKGATQFNSSMYWAARGGHLNIVQLMIQKGADDFNSAINIATEEKHMDIINYLKSLQ